MLYPKKHKGNSVDNAVSRYKDIQQKKTQMKDLVVSKFKRKYEESGKLTVAIMQLLERELETLINKDQFNESNLIKVD